MLGMSRRSAAKCFGDSANQYTMISFHLPPIAASAAVSGQPVTGLERCLRGPLPPGTFLMAFMRQIIFLNKVTNYISDLLGVDNDSRSSKLSYQAGPAGGVRSIV